jgi:hypothetical protein
MNRRDFLFLKSSGRDVVLSCEALYMRFLDARAEGTTLSLFQNLAEDLEHTREVRLTDTSWLSDAVFRDELDRLLETFRRHGGQVIGSRS